MRSSSGPNRLYRHALALHQAGQLAEAAAIYQSLLEKFPDNPQLLTCRGVVAFQLGEIAESLQWFGKSLEIAPDQPRTLSNRALGLHRCNRLDEALASFDRALALQPDYAEALFKRGNVLMDLKRFAEAVLSYDRALALLPDYVEVHNNRGNALINLGRLDEALASFEQALAHKPGHLEAHLNRGIALNKLQRFDEALVCFGQALALQPGYAEAHNHRGTALQGVQRLGEALASYDRALALKPDYVEALNNRGTALRGLQRLTEALASYDRALVLNPDHVEVHINRGDTLYELGRLAEALASYDRALALQPDQVEMHINRGNSLRALRRFAEALTSYDRALALHPGDARAQWNKSLLKIQLGDYEDGWRLYEWGWQNGKRGTPRNFPQRRWLGEDAIAGKVLLIHPEQGLGDFVQFCRYVPLAAALGARVVLETPSALVPLVSTLDGDCTVIEKGQRLPAFDLHCPVMSLPLAFKTTLATIPATVPYLRADEEKCALWRQRLGAKGKPRIGIAWSGNARHNNDHQRSIPFALLQPLFSLPVEFHALQNEIRANDAAVVARCMQLHSHQAELTDFAETAALIEAMDVVLAVDTAVAHVAGALGKEVWILLPFSADYRWMFNRSDSPWYPTARLFRQPAPGDWQSVIAAVTANLTR